MLLGSTFGGLELMSSGAAAGCVVDAVGASSQGTLPAIVGAVNGVGSLSSMVGVSLVSTLLESMGWQGIFQTLSAMATLAAAVLLSTLAIKPSSFVHDTSLHSRKSPLVIHPLPTHSSPPLSCSQPSGFRRPPPSNGTYGNGSSVKQQPGLLGGLQLETRKPKVE